MENLEELEQLKTELLQTPTKEITRKIIDKIQLSNVQIIKVVQSLVLKDIEKIFYENMSLNFFIKANTEKLKKFAAVVISSALLKKYQIDSTNKTSDLEEIDTKVYVFLINRYIEISKLLQQVEPLKPYNDYQYIRQAKLFLEKELYFDFGDYSQFIVLLGDNAQGKTAILQNIAKDINLALFFKNNKAVTKIGNKTENDEQIFLLGYSASRVTIQNSQIDISQEMLRSTGVHHLLDPNPLPLLNIETWLKNKYLDGGADVVEEVCLVLAKMSPECKSVELKGSKVTYTDKYGKVYKYTELSMGQKTIIALMGDIVIRLFDFQPEVEKVEDLQGIVLIDELEAHLHPKWQREFPSLLKRFLPKVQFIVSTHSPMIVLGMPKETCYFHVQKDQEGNIQAEKVEIDVENMLAGQILTSPLFGLETVRHINNLVDSRINSLENTATKAVAPELKDGLAQLKERLKNLKKNEENK